MMAPVAADLISILAPATADPLGSEIWPVRVARNSWATSIPPRQTNTENQRDIAVRTSEASAQDYTMKRKTQQFLSDSSGTRPEGRLSASLAAKHRMLQTRGRWRCFLRRGANSRATLAPAVAATPIPAVAAPLPAA